MPLEEAVAAPPLPARETMKRGCPNHHYPAGARLAGRAVLRGYALPVDAVPCAARCGHPDCLVEGEVHEVDQETLGRIDQLEGHLHT